MSQIIRWGILGTGSIATRFATALSELSNAQLVAVGSRNVETAQEFGAQFDIPNRHSSYAQLANDSDVDVVYVATPNTLHRDNNLLCLHAGKAVLCEKPFTINAAEAAELISLAREKKLFLMEAMWTRFIPAVVKLRELLAVGTIGEVRILQADLGLRGEFDPHHRFFDLSLGGGALLDLGVYVISFATMIFGPPVKITSLGQIGPTGVDEQAVVLLGYPDDQMALLCISQRVQTPQEAVIMGTKGMIRVHLPMYRPTRMTLSWTPSVRMQPPVEGETYHLPFEGNGYGYEAAEVMRCVRAGRHESEIMPLDETLATMETMDEIRRQWGLRFPSEKDLFHD